MRKVHIEIHLGKSEHSLKLDISSQTMGDIYEITGVFFLSQEKHLRSYDEFILKSIWQI